MGVKIWNGSGWAEAGGSELLSRNINIDWGYLSGVYVSDTQSYSLVSKIGSGVFTSVEYTLDANDSTDDQRLRPQLVVDGTVIELHSSLDSYNGTFMYRGMYLDALSSSAGERDFYYETGSDNRYVFLFSSPIKYNSSFEFRLGTNMAVGISSCTCRARVITYS